MMKLKKKKLRARVEILIADERRHYLIYKNISRLEVHSPACGKT